LEESAAVAVGQGSSGEPFARFQANTLLLHGLNDAERIFIDSLTAQKRLIEADFGIGLLPISSIQEELRLGTLRIISLPAFQVSAPIFLIHRKVGYLSKATRTLLSELVKTDE
jgi:DNA-binding transcriptional LysR family regulator